MPSDPMCQPLDMSEHIFGRYGGLDGGEGGSSVSYSGGGGHL